MADLFISYSRRDREAALRLAEALQARQLEVWIDSEDIEPTVDWWGEVQKGIEGADNFLFLISPDSVASPVCGRELAHAVQNGKRLVPVVARTTESKTVTPELRALNFIYLRKEDDFEPSLEKLVTALRTDYEWVQSQRRLQVRALEWERGAHEDSFLLRGRDLQNAEAQLGANSSKEPHPTDLQREYVLKSRQAVDRQRVRTTSIATIAIVVLAVLAVVAFIQSRVARQAQTTAEEKATIARAGELAAQAVSQRTAQFDLSLLLSIEAYRTADTSRTRSVLLDGTQTNLNLIQFLQKHTASVRSVALSPECASPPGAERCSGTLASGSEDRTIVLWDVASRKPIGEPFQGHQDSVNSVAFSPDGKILASGSSDATVRLWDVASHKPIGEPLQGHQGPVNSVAFSPDGKILASAGDQSTVILWDVASRKPLGQPLKHGNVVDVVAFSPDGKTLASASSDALVRLWDVASQQLIGQPMQRDKRDISSVLALAFSPDGKTLASETGSTNITLWDVATQQPIGQPFEGHTDSVWSIAFSPDGKMLASGGADSNIFLWDLSTHRPIGPPLKGHGGTVWSLAFSRECASRPGASAEQCVTTLFSGGRDGRIGLWRLQNRQPIARRLTGHSDSVASVAFSPDGKTFATASVDRTIRLWDASTYRPIGEPLKAQHDAILSIAFSPGGKTLASASQDQTVVLWDLASRQPLGKPFTDHTNSVDSVAFSPECASPSGAPAEQCGKTLAAGSDDGSVILWDIASHKMIGGPLEGPSEFSFINSIAFSPDGKILASADDDNMIELWDVNSQELIGDPLETPGSPVDAVAFSPDGKILASGGYDYKVILWDVASHQRIGQPLAAHTGWVETVAFSPDGSVLASGSTDGTIILWDVESRQILGQPLRGFAGAVYSLAFRPDCASPSGAPAARCGKTLASGDEAPTATLWDLDPQSWIRETCGRVGRNFTRVEWALYFPDDSYRKTCEEWPLEAEIASTPTP